LSSTEGSEVDNQIAAPAETGTPNWHRAIIAQTKSADGRMATEAAWPKGKQSMQVKATILIPIGLLMEGLESDFPTLLRILAPVIEQGRSV
jgi:hypothetical protein